MFLCVGSLRVRRRAFLLGSVAATAVAVAILGTPRARALVLNDNFNGNGFTVIDATSAAKVPNGIDSNNVFNNVVALDAGGCTGTLINSRTILTAAHCFFDSDKGTSGKISTVGFTPTGSGVASTTVTPAFTVINPNYFPKNGTSAADIALIILPTPIANIAPATLLTLTPGSAGFPDKGTTLLIAGFGTNGTGSNPPTKASESDNNRRIAQTTLGAYSAADNFPGVNGTQNVFAAQSRDPANPNRFNFFNFTAGQAQVTTAEGATAPGDSGGPVFYCPTGNGCTPAQLVLIGQLIGGGQPTGGGTKSSGYGDIGSWTPVNLFLSWINGNNGTQSITAQTGTRNFSTAAAWTGGVVPGAADMAWLSTATTMTMDTNATVNSLWVGHAQAALTIPTGNTTTAATGTMINSGTVSVMGTLATPLLGMSGGVLSGTGTVNTTGGIVANYAGTVSPGTSAATGRLTITGDFQQQPSGTLLIKAGATSADQLSVSGTATLGGTLRVALTAQGAPIGNGVSYTVLTANTVAQTFITTTQQLSAFFTGVTTYTTTGVNVALNRTATYASVATTDNTRAFAARLDEARSNPNLSADMRTNILARLDTHSTADAQNFFSREAADGAADDDNDVLGNQLLANLATARMVQGSLDQHLATLRDDTGSMVYGAAGLRSLDFAYASGGGLGFASGRNAAPLPTASEARSSYAAHAAGAAPPYSMWLRVLGGWQTLKGDDNALGVKQKVTGLIGGIDFKPNLDWLPNLKTGVALSYTQGYLGGGSGASETGTTDTYRVSVYGTQTFGRAFLDGHLTYGTVRMSTTRHLQVLDLDRTATGSTTGDEWAASLNAGIRHQIGALLFEPSVGASYIRVTRTGFAESGAGALNLTYESSALESLRFSAGMRTQSFIPLGDGFVLRPEVRMRVSYDARDLMPVTTATMEGLPDAPFAFEGVHVGRRAAVLGGGLTLANGKSLSMFADYNVETRSHETVQTAWGGLRWYW